MSRLPGKALLKVTVPSAQFELSASSLALRKSKVLSVRRLARSLRQHSLIVQAALRQLASHLGLKQSFRLTRPEMARMSELKALAEPYFSVHYVTAMRKDYELLRSELLSFAASGDPLEARSLSKQMLQRVDINLEKIRHTLRGLPEAK